MKMKKSTCKNVEMIYRIMKEDDRKRILFFSPLAYAEDVTRYLIALDSGVNPEEVDRQPVSPAVRSSCEILGRWNLIIDPTPRQKLKDVLRKIQDAFLESPVDMIVIDGPSSVRNDKERKKQ